MNMARVFFIWVTDPDVLDAYKYGTHKDKRAYDEFKSFEWKSYLVENARILDDALRQVSVKYASPDWQRGDIVKIEPFCGDRNSDTYIWNGSVLQDLDSDTWDDYGIVPRDFHVGSQFANPFFWHSNEQVVHNNHVWAEFTPEISHMVNSRYFELNPGQWDIVVFHYNSKQWQIFLYKHTPSFVPVFDSDNIGLFSNQFEDVYNRASFSDYEIPSENYDVIESALKKNPYANNLMYTQWKTKTN